MSRSVRVPLEGLRGGERSVDGPAAHYLGRVHRLGPGARFVAFDPGARLEAAAEIVAAERGVLRCRFDEPTPARAAGERGLTLIQCAGKGDKLDEVVRAATALGVSVLRVAESERSVSRPSGSSAKRERLLAVALDAARQSGRGDLPELAEPAPLAGLLAEYAARDACKLCLAPEAELGLGAALAARAGRELVLLVGPEGGLSEAELAGAAAAGFVSVSLGPLVLRTELAGIAALGAVLALRA
ncbi:MAG TPA: RsmE family RNA methyltransferase [Polyangiaceae bacterium]